MNYFENTPLTYISKFTRSKIYFNRKNAQLTSFTPEVKLFYSYLYLNPVTIELSSPDDKGLDSLRTIVMKDLNLSPEKYQEAYRTLCKLSMLRYKQISVDQINFIAIEDNTVILSEDFNTDEFISVLPENYLRYYLFLKNHPNKVNGIFIKSIAEISNDTGLNQGEVGQMNNFFKSMGYVEISKSDRNGINAYKVIK